MNWEIQILLVVTTGVSSFSTQNSTLVTDSNNLFKPIIIPNITKYFEQPQTAKTTGSVKAKDPDQKRGTHEPMTPTENYSDEEFKVSENSLKFSSRYSTKETELSYDKGRTEQTIGGATEVPDSERDDNGIRNGESQKVGSFSDRSDDLDSIEEEKNDVRKYFDSYEPEESELTPTTNEPFQDLPRPTSFQRSSYPDEDLESYEISSTTSEEEDGENEKEKPAKFEEAEEKRSVGDYYNSGSKNYHSVQTPLENIQYRGPHSFRDDFDSGKIRTRLLSPIGRSSTGPKWPYSRSQTKAEPEDTNDISESEESNLEEGIRKELRGESKTTGLELAVEKDERRFDDKRKYNFLKERDRRKKILKSLALEEEKDHRSLPFQTLKQYQVDEEPRYQPPKLRLNEVRRVVTTTPRNIFLDPPKQKPKTEIPQELSSAVFQAHQFLGPVVFSPKGDQGKSKAAARAHAKNGKKNRNVFAKDLLEREKLDQDGLTDERFQKSVFGTGSGDLITRSFNHLEENEEMYNAILANIQSVFGLRTSKSSVGSSHSSGPGLDESRSLTWSLPKTKLA